MAERTDVSPQRRCTQSLGRRTANHRPDAPANGPAEKTPRISSPAPTSSVSLDHLPGTRKGKAPENRGFFGKTRSVSAESGSEPDWVAERVGFEPTVRVSVHLISSQARSTTPAPLNSKRRIIGANEAPGTQREPAGVAPSVELNAHAELEPLIRTDGIVGRI